MAHTIKDPEALHEAARASFGNAVDNIAEEEISSLFGKIDPSMLKESKIFLTIAILFKRTPVVFRHIVANFIAAYVQKNRNVPQSIKRPLAIFLKSLPQGIDEMLKGDDFTVEELEAKLRESFNARGVTEVKKDGPWEAAVGINPASHLIHKKGMHDESLTKEMVTNRGSEFHIFRTFGGVYRTCPFCYPDEPAAEAPAEEEVEHHEEKKEEEKHKAILAHFKDRVVADAYGVFCRHSGQEGQVFKDLGEGLEGEGAFFARAMAWYLDLDPTAAEALFTKERAEEVLRIVKENHGKKPSERENLAKRFENELSTVYTEYLRLHPDLVPPAVKDNLDMLWQLAPENIKSEHDRSKLMTWLKESGIWLLDLVLKFGYGGLGIIIVVSVLGFSFAGSAMAPIIFWMFILTLLGSVGFVVLAPRSWIAAKIAVVLGMVYVVSLYYAIAFVLASMFTDDPSWAGRSFWLGGANLLVADVISWRSTDLIVHNLRGFSVNFTALIKGLVPGGENAAEYRARKAEESEKEVRYFRRIIFNVAVILTLAMFPVGAAHFAQLESMYIRYSMYLSMAIISAAYLRSMLFVGDSHIVVEDLREDSRLQRLENFRLGFWMMKWGIAPAVLAMAFFLLVDPFHLAEARQDDPSYKYSIAWHVRDSAFVNAVDAAGDAVSGRMLNEAQAMQSEEEACANSRKFLEEHPRFCDEPVMADNAICVDKVRCGIRSSTEVGRGWSGTSWLCLGLAAAAVVAFYLFVTRKSKGGATEEKAGHH